MTPHARRRPPVASAGSGCCALSVAGCLRVAACGALDQARDGLAAFGVQPEEGAELRSGDTGVPDEREQLDLLPPQPELVLVVIIEEEARRHAEGLGQRLDNPQLRVGQLAVAQLPDGGGRDLLPGRRVDPEADLGIGEPAAAGGCACSRIQLTLSARVFNGTLPVPAGTASSAMLILPRPDWPALSGISHHPAVLAITNHNAPA